MNKKRTFLEKRHYGKSALVVFVETLKSLAMIEDHLSALWMYKDSEY